MMAMTINSSISVKPARDRAWLAWCIGTLLMSPFAPAKGRLFAERKATRNAALSRSERRRLFLRVAQAFEQRQQRHEQGDDDRADDEAEDDDHDRLEQADQR